MVKEGMTGVKFLRERDPRAIVKAILEYSGVKESVSQVYNHLRHWRARWVQVAKLRMADGADWDEITSTVKIDDEAYYAHIKVRSVDLLIHFGYLMFLCWT